MACVAYCKLGTYLIPFTSEPFNPLSVRGSPEIHYLTLYSDITSDMPRFVWHALVQHRIDFSFRLSV